MTEPVPPTPEALRARLDRLAAARGFLLPHHGALAAGAPDLHAAYQVMYDALTVAPRHLSPLARECVWLAILVTVEEGIGTHHLELFRREGGSDAVAEALITLTGAAASCDSLHFAGHHWGHFLPALDPAAAYSRAIAALRGPVPDDLAELCLIAVQAARGSHAGIVHHLRRAYELGIPEPEIVEALSYLIWPRGVNCFLEACAIWHGLMVGGQITPSPLFAVWRDMPGQGPYDPGAGSSVTGFADDKSNG